MTDCIICTQVVKMIMNVMINVRGVLICKHGMRFWGIVTTMIFRGYKVLLMA